MAITLKEVVEELQQNKQATDGVKSAIQEWMAVQKRESLNEKEARIEAKNEKKGEKSRAYQMGYNAQNAFSIPLGLLLNPAKLIGPLLAGVTAFAAGIAGLRGWERLAIDGISGAITSLTRSVLNGVTALRDAILIRYFGFSPGNVPTRGLDGRFGKGVSVSEQIAQRIANMRNGVLRLFGIGDDGSALVRIKDMFGRSPIGRVVRMVGRLLRPVVAVGRAIGEFITGAGARIFSFMGPLMRNAGGFVRLFSNILKPLGFIISAYHGVMEFMGTEGTLFEKFSAGISAFLGDFIGAPLNLLRDLVAWVTDQLGFSETADWMREWNFRELVSGYFNALFDFVGSAVDWVKHLFTDPGAALDGLWKGVFGEMSLVDVLLYPINAAISWVGRVFEWRDADAPDFDLVTFVKDIWDNAMQGLKDGFQVFADWIVSIPDKVLLASLGKLNETSLGDYLVSDDVIERVRRRVLEAEGMTNFGTPLSQATLPPSAQTAERLESGLATLSEMSTNLNVVNTSTVTNISQGAIVMDQGASATDDFGGGIRPTTGNTSRW